AAGSAAQRAARLVEEAYRPFDLAAGPLLRLRLFAPAPDGDGEYLLFVIHHLIADFASLSVLGRELGELYREETGGTTARLAPLTVQHTDFVHWQERWLTGPRGEWLWSYWRDRLTPLPSDLELPIDRHRPAVQAYRGGARALRLPGSLAEGLQTLG